MNVFMLIQVMFRESFTTLFQASWLSVEASSSLMRIGFLYYNCLDLISRLTTPILYRILYRQY